MYESALDHSKIYVFVFVCFTDLKLCRIQSKLCQLDGSRGQPTLKNFQTHKNSMLLATVLMRERKHANKKMRSLRKIRDRRFFDVNRPEMSFLSVLEIVRNLFCQYFWRFDNDFYYIFIYNWFICIHYLFSNILKMRRRINEFDIVSLSFVFCISLYWLLLILDRIFFVLLYFLYYSIFIW